MWLSCFGGLHPDRTPRRSAAALEISAAREGREMCVVIGAVDVAISRCWKKG